MNDPHIIAARPNISAWVGANAGSGKTYVLISRLVTLMLKGSPPERLLCLTYTRSAAAEMQGRLFDLLSEWALLDDIELKDKVFERTGFELTTSDEFYRARTLFARALETPGGLRVQTIHAFCESLLHRFPLEAGLVPGFELLDDVRGNEVIEDIVSTLMRYEDDPDLASGIDLLSRHMQTDDLIVLAKRLIRERSRYHRPDTLEGLHRHLSEMFGDVDMNRLAQQQMALIADLHGLEPELLKRSLESQASTDQKLAENLRAFKAAPDFSAQWSVLKTIFLTGKGELRKQIFTKAFHKSTPELADTLVEMQNTFYSFERMSRIANARALSDALYRLADRLLQEYYLHKHRANELDYDDLIDFSNHLLINAQSAAWVMFKIDGGLDHILIDEAQDTSERQWRLINALAEEFFVGASAREETRTIFAVGDEKQSIFSFQGADPSAFDAMRQHFERLVVEAGSTFKHVPLTMSRRSTPEILEAVDAIFKPTEHRAGLTVSDQDILHEAYRAHDVGYVEVWPAIRIDRIKSDDTPDAIPDITSVQTPSVLLAERIALKIRSLLDQPGGHIRPQDILVLVRQRNAFFAEMLRALNAQAIPIAGADRMSLLDEVAIKDLIIAGEVALIPENDLALAILMRSPLVGMNEEALFEIAYNRSGSLVEALFAAAQAQPTNTTYTAARDLIVWLTKAVDELTPFDFYAQLLSGRGGQAQLKARLGPQIDDAISELLRLALNYERGDPASLQGFLDWVQNNATEIKRDMDQESEAVRIMTVHGAKGLEAPIVFLPDNCQPPSQSARQRIFISHNNLAWRAKTAETFESDLERQAAAFSDDLEESRRLLYVALTRAKDRLYIGGYMGGSANSNSTPNPASWYGMVAASPPANARCHDPDLVATADGDASFVWSLGEEEKAGPFRKEDKETPLMTEPVPAWLSNHFKPETVLSSEKEAPRAFEHIVQPIAVTTFIGHHNESIERPRDWLADEQSEQIQTMRASDLGQIIHRLFEHLPDVARTDRDKIADNYLSLYAPTLNLADRAQQVAAINRVLDNPSLAPLFGQGARAERPIIGWLTAPAKKTVYLTGQIDRYVHDHAQNWIWIADFKTGIPQYDNQAYLGQMALYRHLLREASGVDDIRCSLIWTQSGENTFFDTDKLDRALEDIFTKL